jgi:hypothetical protein
VGSVHVRRHDHNVIGYGLAVGIPGVTGYVMPLLIAGVGLINLNKMA